MSFGETYLLFSIVATDRLPIKMLTVLNTQVISPLLPLSLFPLMQFSALQRSCPFMFYTSKYSATCFHFYICFTYAPGHCTAQLCTTFACYSYHRPWPSSVPYFIPYNTFEPWKMEAGSSSKSSLLIISKKTTFHRKKLNVSWCFCFFTAL
jgi:hypothetical protein